MRYRCIHRRRHQHSIRMMCRLLQVSRSGYYDWSQRAESARSLRDRELQMLIRQIHLESNGVYGARKIHRELLSLGEEAGRHRVARLMRADGLKGCPMRRFRRRPNEAPSHPIAANVLNQDFRADERNQRWASDITQLWTRQGWLYLAVVMDLYSRRIVGWSMSRRNNRQLVLNAMHMALGRREVSSQLIHHSDRGAQYLSDDFQLLLKRNGITCSLSGKGSCYDNAVVESFFSTLKRERVKRRRYRTRDQARADIFDYIERFYNRERRHGYVGNISPAHYEDRTLRT